jgi:hypothetical protein
MGAMNDGSSAGLSCDLAAVLRAASTEKVSTPQAQRFRYDRVRMDFLSGVVAHLLAGHGKTCNAAG